MGVLPHPVPITTVIGRPIDVPKYEGARVCTWLLSTFNRFGPWLDMLWYT